MIYLACAIAGFLIGAIVTLYSIVEYRILREQPAQVVERTPEPVQAFGGPPAPKPPNFMEGIKQALMALGYTSTQAARSAKAAAKQHPATLEAGILLALK